VALDSIPRIPPSQRIAQHPPSATPPPPRDPLSPAQRIAQHPPSATPPPHAIRSPPLSGSRNTHLQPHHRPHAIRSPPLSPLSGPHRPPGLFPKKSSIFTCLKVDTYVHIHPCPPRPTSSRSSANSALNSIAWTTRAPPTPAAPRLRRLRRPVRIPPPRLRRKIALARAVRNSTSCCRPKACGTGAWCSGMARVAAAYWQCWPPPTDSSKRLINIWWWWIGSRATSRRFNGHRRFNRHRRFNGHQQSRRLLRRDPLRVDLPQVFFCILQPSAVGGCAWRERPGSASPTKPTTTGPWTRACGARPWEPCCAGPDNWTT
jgi:hypothetical protein